MRSTGILTLICALAAAGFSPFGCRADDAQSSSSSSSSAFIVGRIEQTADPDSTLPVKLTKLKAETPKMDVVPPTVLTAGVTHLESEVSEASFPSGLLGFWGGALTITGEYHRSNMPLDPDRMPGAIGNTVFHFYQEGNDVKLKPGVIFLAPTEKPLENCLMTPGQLESMKERAAAAGTTLDPQQMLHRNPQVILGNITWEKLDGATLAATVTANDLHMLSPGVYEQDIVTKREGSTATGRDTGGYSEVICRFKQTGPDSEYVQAAKITYAADRTMIRRILLEGTVTRDWQPFAEKISKQLNRPWDVIARNHDL